MSFCDCTANGYCPRYKRPMGGRLRELCAGVNVDLGTAAAFREQWAREAGPTAFGGAVTPLLLKADQAPGDMVAMTAAIHSLHRAHPGRYVTAVDCRYPEVFAHNPDVVPAQPGMAPLQMHYPAVHQSNDRAIHFMQGWCEFLGYALGVQVPLLTNRPHLYFDHGKPAEAPYWVVCSGGKADFTNKIWPGYQEVVSSLFPKLDFAQVGSPCDYHPTLRNAINLVGKTSLRQLFNLVRRAQGVLCGVSLLMHVAAALEKPAVVIAGGREPVAWNAYPKQRYLHTVGTLSCCSSACWKSRVKPLGDGSPHDESLCERPVSGVPECMARIQPAHVAELISSMSASISAGKGGRL